MSNPYEAVGKEGAFFSLYTNDFKGKYLDAYSYGPLTIKREVDQNHVKTMEFNEKVREFELNYDLKLKEFDLKKQKAMLDAGIDPATGLPKEAIIPTGKKENVGDEEGYAELKVTEKELKDFDNALKGLQAVVPGLGETSLTELAEKVTDKDIASSQVKEYVIGGKKVKLDFSKPNVRNAIINFDKKVVAVSPEIKRVREQFGNLKGDVLNKILKEVQVKVDKGSRRQIFNKMRSDLVDKIGYDNFRKLPTSLDKLESKIIVEAGGSSYEMAGSLQRVRTVTRDGITRPQRNAPGVAERTALSDLGFWDTESSGSSMASVFNDGLGIIKRDFDINLAESTMVPTNTSFEVTSQDYRSKALKQAIGQEKNKNKVEITYLMNSKGEPDGRIQYSYWVYDNDKGTTVKKWGGILEKEKAEALGFAHTKELKYDFTGDYGKDAHVFDLGGVHDSEVDKSVKTRTMQRYGGLLPMDDPNNFRAIEAAARNTGDMQLVNKVLTEMRRFHEDPGFLDVKLQGNDEDKMYHLSLKTESGGSYSVPVAKGFSTNEVGNFLYDESLYMKHAVFTQYLNDMINTESTRAAIRTSQSELQKMLGQ